MMKSDQNILTFCQFSTPTTCHILSRGTSTHQ